MDRYASLSPVGRHRGPATTDPSSATPEVAAAPAPAAVGPQTPAAAPATPDAGPKPHSSPATSGDRTQGDPDAGTTARPAADA